jgi:hypothetical protein
MRKAMSAVSSVRIPCGHTHGARDIVTIYGIRNICEKRATDFVLRTIEQNLP